MKVLSLLPEAHGAHACLEAALAAASVATDGRVEAFHVVVDPARLVRAPEEIAIQRLRESVEGTAQQRETEVRQVFDAWMAGLTQAERARVAWRDSVGAEDEIVTREANGADLLVLARPQDMDAGDALHAAVFESHRPLLVPADWRRQPHLRLAERIAIAWRPTDQARRAVRQSAPWLQQATSLIVLQIEEHGEDVDASLEIDMLLGDMGLRSESLTRPANHKEPGEALLAMVEDAKADALVMGAYRHNEWIEWALGGTTRYVLSHARVPLLLAH